MKQKIVIIFMFACIFASSFYFGFERLRNFSGVDEPYWSYTRVPKFWDAIKKMEWKRTSLCDKPGITIAAVSGIGLPFINEDYKSIKELKKFRYEPKTEEQLQRIESLYFHLRLPVFLFTLAMLPLLYFLISKLLGEKIAAFATIFIGLSPILLGISLIINSDAMLWIFSTLSILNLFLFLKKNERKYLIFSGLALGLAVIDKFVANILFVFFFLIFLMEYFLHAHKKMEIATYLKQAFLNYLILFGTAMATGFAFWPAAWIDFHKLIKYTVGHPVFSSTWPIYPTVVGLLALDMFLLKSKFSKIIFGFFIRYKNALVKTVGAIFLFLIAVVLLHVYTGIHVVDLESIIASPKGIGSGNIAQRYGGAMLADIYSLIFSISPLVLFSFLFSIYGLLKKKELDRKSIVIFYLLFFILIFYLGAAVNEVIATVRYQIMTYPLVFISAAIGISEFLEICPVKFSGAGILQSKIISRGKKIIHNIPFALIVVFIILETSLFFIKPNFLAYASEILPKNFIVNLKGMGEGSYEAANYLNQLPGAHDMIIWSDKGAVCERFVGKCFIDFKKKTFSENKIDYFVLSTDRMSRTVKLSKGIKVVDEERIRAKEELGPYVDFSEMYAMKDAVYEFIIGGNPNNFVKIIKTENISK